MKFEEKKSNVFKLYPKYDLAHCISADFGMGRGIAVQFNEELNMKHELLKNYPGYLKDWQAEKKTHGCLYLNGVYNLVTKEHYWYKPNPKHIKGALMDMKELVMRDGANRKIAMPRIGCGLDNQNWDEIKAIIQEVFADTDVEIVVCTPYRIDPYGDD